MPYKAWVQICLAMLWGSISTSGAMAPDSDCQDWLGNPVMGNYKAYAEFKMTHYAKAREV